MSTAFIHPTYHAPTGFRGVQQPSYKAATVLFDNVAHMRINQWHSRTGYTYGLHGTPATFALEAQIAQLEGARHALLLPSGLASIACVNLAFLKSGDVVLIPDNAYNPNKELAKGLLARMGVSYQIYNPLNPADLAVKLAASTTARTQLVWLEAAGSVTLEFPPLPDLVHVCRMHEAAQTSTQHPQRVLCALDNTWGAGLAFAPFDLGQGLGVDIATQALTKYASGGGDVLMGSVSTCSDALFSELQTLHMHMGYGVGGDDVSTVLRSLPSIALRYRAQAASAYQLATWLTQWSAASHNTSPPASPIAHVLHPALTGSPGHGNWKAVCGTSGLAAGLLSLVFAPHIQRERVDAFCEHLQLFKLGYSWGGPLSLVVPYQLHTVRQLPASMGASAGVHVVRLCIGLEDTADLQADIAQALTVLTTKA